MPPSDMVSKPKARRDSDLRKDLIEDRKDLQSAHSRDAYRVTLKVIFSSRGTWVITHDAERVAERVPDPGRLARPAVRGHVGAAAAFRRF